MNQTQLGLGALVLVLAIIGARIIATAWHSDRQAREQLPDSGRHRAPKHKTNSK